jgi:pyruvate/2-oxoglutarate dehydrogenase complex dihydrolipoamide acyltransferase (E2) component
MEPIRLPKLGPSMKEGLIVEWLVKEGDRITKGQPILQLETDKAVGEFESPVEGVVLQISKPAGSKVAVGETLAVVE